MKKYLKSLIICFILVPCLFFLFACNGTSPTEPPTLTKQQYANALLAVSNSLSGEDGNNRNARTDVNISIKKSVLKLSNENQISTVAESGPPQVVVPEEEYTLELGESCYFNEINTINGVVLTCEVEGEITGNKNEWVKEDEIYCLVFTPQEIDNYTLTITATDKNNNSTSTTILIIVKDTLKPTLELNNQYPHSTFVNYSNSTIVVDEGSGNEQTDDNGNTIKWAENKFPSINLPGVIAKDEYEETGFASLSAIGTLTIVSPDGASYTIDSKGNITSSQNELNLTLNTGSTGDYFTFTPTKRGHYTVTYSAEDKNGNLAEKEETIDIYIGDTEVPIIYLTNNLVNNLNKTILANGDELVINTEARIKGQTNYNLYDLYVEDNYGFNTSVGEDDNNSYEYVIVSVSVTNQDSTTIKPQNNNKNTVTYEFNTAGTYTITFTVADNAGNVGIVSRTFVVEEDNENPIIYLTSNLTNKLNNGFIVGENDELVINAEARIKNQTGYNTQDIYVEDNYGFNVIKSEGNEQYEYVVVTTSVVNENSVLIAPLTNADNVLTYKFTTAGNYTITFEVTDYCGNEGVFSKTFVVSNASTTTPVNPTDPTDPPPSTNVTDPTNPSQNCDKSMPILLFKFVSLVMQNPNYEETTETIAYSLHPDPVNHSDMVVYLRQRLSYDGTYISGAFISSETINSQYNETISFKIKYNFNTNELVSYEIYDEYVMTYKTVYQSFVLENNQEYAFRCESGETLNEQAEILKLKIHNACKVELEREVVSKNYNFDDEYAQATQGANV